ncbi:enoyl-CoA hydratase-related protein [Alicyclobacillus dauci]|uniref:Enoyl-CoA hydratase-related protein n=1 Tax=Alicyclobacillus dauci TaxID=1475485 RepID=A0ABY6YXC6_9BACL|nr:enoyl-CoA hydratase-related protein [Alicyclobacillus dauci]WAH35177.1 enoyl-CoA hydratase-related protein [Alicyclobacillus dauci]
MYETITLKTNDAVATITLNRPDKLNAFTPLMHQELVDALTIIEGDSHVRAVVLTGNGRAFCSGQDLTAVQTGESIDYQALLKEGYNPIIEKLTGLEKPIVTAVNGVAAGAGVSLALACDLKVASDKASFVQAFVHVGLVPDSGSTWFLPRQVGLAKAMELAMLGERISADEALRVGLINRVVPHETVLDEATALATRLAELPTRAIGLTKRAFYQGMVSTLSEALDNEAELQARASQTYDHHEGISAFLEKRKPQFRGK